MNNSLSFIITVYNKEDSISDCIKSISSIAQESKLDYEIICIDDNSSDSSWNILQELSQQSSYNLKLLRSETNQGFAKTYFKGVSAACKQKSICISPDNDIEKEQLQLVLEKINSSPIVIQSYSNLHERSKLRYFIAYFYVKFMNLVSGHKLSYYNGCNIYPTETLKNISHREYSFAFQSDVLIQMLEKFEFQEVNIKGNFADHNSSALKISNIVGVTLYMLRSIFR